MTRTMTLILLTLASAPGVVSAQGQAPTVEFTAKAGTVTQYYVTRQLRRSLVGLTVTVAPGASATARDAEAYREDLRRRLQAAYAQESRGSQLSTTVVRVTSASGSGATLEATAVGGELPVGARLVQEITAGGAVRTYVTRDGTRGEETTGPLQMFGLAPLPYGMPLASGASVTQTVTRPVSSFLRTLDSRFPSTDMSTKMTFTNTLEGRTADGLLVFAFRATSDGWVARSSLQGNPAVLEVLRFTGEGKSSYRANGMLKGSTFNSVTRYRAESTENAFVVGITAELEESVGVSSR